MHICCKFPKTSNAWHLQLEFPSTGVEAACLSSSQSLGSFRYAWIIQGQDQKFFRWHRAPQGTGRGGGLRWFVSIWRYFAGIDCFTCMWLGMYDLHEGRMMWQQSVHLRFHCECRLAFVYRWYKEVLNNVTIAPRPTIIYLCQQSYAKKRFIGRCCIGKGEKTQEFSGAQLV